MIEPKPEALRKLLGRRLQITIIDGRVFTGNFICTDQRCNIVLDHTVEFQPISNQSREVSLITISLEHLLIIKAHAQDIKSEDQEEVLEKG
ncbi:hypothetical protein DFH28DRAFT_18931 [Melampsora americana]|nr:hypothetical protein DFH28DRAFT_18931 [Melampsora americana]